MSLEQTEIFLGNGKGKDGVVRTSHRHGCPRGCRKVCGGLPLPSGEIDGPRHEHTAYGKIQGQTRHRIDRIAVGHKCQARRGKSWSEPEAAAQIQPIEAGKVASGGRITEDEETIAGIRPVATQRTECEFAGKGGLGGELDFTKPGGACEEDSVAGGVAELFAATAALSITASNIAEPCSIRLPLSASRV